MVNAVNTLFAEVAEDVANAAQLLRDQKFRGVSDEERHELLRMVAQGYSDDAIEMHPVLQRLAVHKQLMVQTHRNILEDIVIKEQPLAVAAAPFAGVDEMKMMQEFNLRNIRINTNQQFQHDFKFSVSNELSDEELAQFFRSHFANNARRNIFVLLCNAISRDIRVEVIKIVMCIYEVGLLSYFFDNIRLRLLKETFTPSNMNLIVHSVEGQIFWRRWAAAYQAVSVIDVGYEYFNSSLPIRIQNTLIQYTTDKITKKVFDMFWSRSGNLFNAFTSLGGGVKDAVVGFVSNNLLKAVTAGQESLYSWVFQGFIILQEALFYVIKYVEKQPNISAETKFNIVSMLKSLISFAATFRINALGMVNGEDKDMFGSDLLKAIELPKSVRIKNWLIMMGKIWLIWTAEMRGDVVVYEGKKKEEYVESVAKRFLPDPAYMNDVEKNELKFAGAPPLSPDLPIPKEGDSMINQGTDGATSTWTKEALNYFTSGLTQVYTDRQLGRYALMTNSQKVAEIINEVGKTFPIIDLSLFKLGTDILTSIFHLVMSQIPKRYKTWKWLLGYSVVTFLIPWFMFRVRLFTVRTDQSPAKDINKLRTPEELTAAQTFKDANPLIIASYYYQIHAWSPAMSVKQNILKEKDVPNPSNMTQEAYDAELKNLKDEYLSTMFPTWHTMQYSSTVWFREYCSTNSFLYQMGMQLVLWSFMGGIQTCASTFTDVCNGFTHIGSASFNPFKSVTGTDSVMPLGCSAQSSTTTAAILEPNGPELTNVREYHFMCSKCRDYISQCKDLTDASAAKKEKANQNGNILQFLENRIFGSLTALTCSLCTNQKLNKQVKSRRQQMVAEYEQLLKSRTGEPVLTDFPLKPYSSEVRVLCTLKDKKIANAQSLDDVSLVYTPTMFGLKTCEPDVAFLALLNKTNNFNEQIKAVPPVFYSYCTWYTKFKAKVAQELSFPLNLEIYRGESLRDTFETYDTLLVQCLQILYDIMKDTKKGVDDYTIGQLAARTIDLNPKFRENKTSEQLRVLAITELTNVLIQKRLFTANELMNLARPSKFKRTANFMQRQIRGVKEGVETLKRFTKRIKGVKQD